MKMTPPAMTCIKKKLLFAIIGLALLSALPACSSDEKEEPEQEEQEYFIAPPRERDTVPA